jgi:hypothetical protein
MKEFRSNCKSAREDMESFLVPTKYVIRNFNLLTAVKALIKEEKHETQ